MLGLAVDISGGGGGSGGGSGESNLESFPLLDRRHLREGGRTSRVRSLKNVSFTYVRILL
jgi:hypothetical protein